MQLQLPGYGFTNISRMLIKAFRQTGISLCPSGIDVRGLPNLIVGLRELELESDEEVELVMKLRLNQL